MQYKYTTTYIRILLAIVVLFLIVLVFGKGQSSDVKDTVKESPTTGTSLNVEQWLMQQNQLNLRDAFTKAGI